MRPEPLVLRVSEWADEDPETMHSLLRDADLRGQLLRALVDLGIVQENPGSDNARSGVEG